MLLTIDIGNSSTKFGVFEDLTLKKRISIKTIRKETSDSIFSRIKKRLRI